MIHPDKDYPPIMPQNFEIEPFLDFDPSTVGYGFGPFHFKTPTSAVSYITKVPSGLAF
jgi:hypothetical protein